MPLRVFLTHSPEDLEVDFGRALPELEPTVAAIADHDRHIQLQFHGNDLGAFVERLLA